MNNTWLNKSGLGIVTSIVIGLAAGAPLIGFAQTAPPAPPDSIVQVTAESKGLGLADPLDFIDGGTFWQMEPDGLSAPMPCPPQNPNLPVYQIANGQFLIDATGGLVATNGEMNTTIEAALAAQVESVVKLVDWLQGVEEIQNMKLLARAMGMNLPDFGDEGEGGAGTNSGWTSSFVLDTNALYLTISNVVNGVANLSLHNGTNEVYAIWTTNNLGAGWQVETELWPTGDQTNVMPFTLPTWDRDKLFVRAQDWTGVDSNGDGIPDWWMWNYFGDLTLNATNLDGSGHSLWYDYTNNLVTNAIVFSGIVVTNNYVNTSVVPVQLKVAGYPYYQATLVDNTTLADAEWINYGSSNLVVNLGLTQGWHGVLVGLRSHADSTNAAVWQWKRLNLDWTPPTITITNPMAGADVTGSYLQVQGMVDEALSSLTYAVSNATGILTNQSGSVTGQYLDPDTQLFTTNYFQLQNIQLADGVNTVTIHAADLAGNQTSTALNFTRSPTPPAFTLIWPQSGTAIMGDQFTIQGTVDDVTATVAAVIVDANGSTNTVSGVVEKKWRGLDQSGAAGRRGKHADYHGYRGNEQHQPNEPDGATQ